MPEQQADRWLIFFYSIPASPVKNRVRIWRKLQRTGAIQLKSGVYILPYREDNHEALQWLLTELPNLGGEGLLVTSDAIEPLRHNDIIALFNHQKELEYSELHQMIEDLSGRIESVRKGGKDRKATSLFRQYEKIYNEFAKIRSSDFFKSKPGQETEERLKALKVRMEAMPTLRPAGKLLSGTMPQIPLQLSAFSGMNWLTRKRPFVDRMASAWLVRRFIDRQSVFIFCDEATCTADTSLKNVTFDVRGGVFTHVEDLCTFEVLLQSFGLCDEGLRRIAEIVHDLDIKDGKFGVPEALGIELILKGIRNRNLSDDDTLEQGMTVFEALYLSFTEKP